MTTHIENLEIHSYRGVQNLKIDDLGAVNILVGDNNTGKTSVLEAIQLLCAPNKYNLVQIARQREKNRARMGINLIDSIKYLFDIRCNGYENLELSLGGSILGENIDVYVSGGIETQFVDLNELASKQFISRNRVGDDTEEVDTFLGRIAWKFSWEDQWNSVDEFEVNNY